MLRDHERDDQASDVRGNAQARPAARCFRAVRASVRLPSINLACAIPLLLFATPALADSNLPPAALAYEQLPDPKQEAEAKALMESIRCLVCQGQSIIDSDADMAGDMRALIRREIAAGKEPEAIRAWLIERYGNWVSYKPALDASTLPLFALPVLLGAAGLWLARGRFRRRA